MPDSSCAVIISVYKDTEALGLILDALLHQSILPAEIIVSEDGNAPSMKTFVESWQEQCPTILHLTQDDNGWRKNRALNRAIAAARSDYLIFIDGDCVPYPEFVAEHLKLKMPNTVLCGRRSEPGERFSAMLRNRSISLKNYENHYIRNFFALKKDQVKHYEEGIYLGSSHPIFHLVHALSRKESHIVGCHFSCYKSDMIRINGFDEDFTMPTTGEDSDIERRMRLIGITMKSCRNAANMVHLYHPKNFDGETAGKTVALMNSKGDEPFCHNGLNQHLGGQA